MDWRSLLQAQTENTRFQIRQNRSAPTGVNDNSANTDHFGILELNYEYKETTVLTFVPVMEKYQQQMIRSNIVLVDQQILPMHLVFLQMI